MFYLYILDINKSAIERFEGNEIRNGSFTGNSFEFQK